MEVIRRKMIMAPDYLPFAALLAEAAQAIPSITPNGHEVISSPPHEDMILENWGLSRPGASARQSHDEH